MVFLRHYRCSPFHTATYIYSYTSHPQVLMRDLANNEVLHRLPERLLFQEST